MAIPSNEMSILIISMSRTTFGSSKLVPWGSRDGNCGQPLTYL